MITPKEKKFSTVPVLEKVEHVCDWAEEKKGKDLIALDLSGVNSFTDAVVIVTAQSVRQAQAIAEHVLMNAKKSNYEYLRVEGKDSGQWILVDLNDIVVNIFQEDTRSLFNLESLWADAKVIRQASTED